MHFSLLNFLLFFLPTSSQVSNESVQTDPQKRADLPLCDNIVSDLRLAINNPGFQPSHTSNRCFTILLPHPLKVVSRQPTAIHHHHCILNHKTTHSGQRNQLYSTSQNLHHRVKLRSPIFETAIKK